MSHHRYTLGEEIANSVTHGVGAALSIAALTLSVAFAVEAGDLWRIVSFTIYGTSLVLLYLFSTLYHAIPHARTKAIFRRLDHIAIYLLIAGSYTPFLLVTLRRSSGWILLAVIWGLAITGIVLKILALERWRRLSLFVYLGMGWLCVFVLRDLVAALPTAAVAWLVAGGLAYTGGVVFYVWRSIPFNHAIWHLFVLLGSAAHFVALFGYVL